MTPKEYLSQLRQVKIQLRAIQDEINEQQIRAGYGTSSRVACNLSGTDHHCRMEDVILDERNWALDQRLAEKHAELYAVEQAIMDAIYAVEDMTYQSILLLRYVRCLGWEQIAWKMNYGLDNIYKLHGKALLMIRFVNPAK